MQKLKLKSLMTFLILSASCGRTIKFNPDFYVGDSEHEYIINENGNIVMPHQKEFNDFACMHREKVKELKELLERRCK